MFSVGRKKRHCRKEEGQLKGSTRPKANAFSPHIVWVPVGKREKRESEPPLKACARWVTGCYSYAFNAWTYAFKGRGGLLGDFHPAETSFVSNLSLHTLWNLLSAPTLQGAAVQVKFNSNLSQHDFSDQTALTWDRIPSNGQSVKSRKVDYRDRTHKHTKGNIYP